MRKASVLVSTFVSALLLSAPLLAQTAPYTEDFQAYGEHANPTGWVDSSVGTAKPDASGLYKTWGDPTQGNKARNIVYGTKSSSGKADPNGRMGTFSTFTTKAFSGVGRFEFRGRFIRTNNDSRIGLTFFSNYPDKDQYYLAGLMPQANGTLTMQLLSFGAGTFTGTTDSKFTPNADQWCWFDIQADSLANETDIRARFWVDGANEPATWSIEAVDKSAARLTQGRIGVWAAIKGDAYIDDLSVKSNVDHTAPSITFFESNTAMTDNQVFNRDASPEIRVTDDSSGVGTVTIKLDGDPYVSKTAVTTELIHQLDVDAVDKAGNAAHATLHFVIDKSAPVITILDAGTPIVEGTIFNHDVKPVITISDLTKTTSTVTLDGAPFTAGTTISTETAHKIAVTANDSAQHSASATVNFRIDRTGPSLTVTSIKDGDVVTDPTIVLSGGADDAITVKVNGIAATVDTAAHTWKSGTIALVEGQNTIKIAGFDAGRNEGDLSVTVNLDTRAPQITITAPDQNECLNTKVINVHGTIADAHPKSVTVNNVTATLDATGSWSATFSDVPEGKTTFLVTATDTVGHSAGVTRTMSVDRTQPVIDVYESGAPFTAKLVNRPVSLDFRVNDADPNATLTVTLDGVGQAPSPVQVSKEGSHELKASAKDCAGLTSERTVTFTTDLTPPELTSFDPANGSTIGTLPASIKGMTKENATITSGSASVVATAGAFTLSGLTFAEGTNKFTLHAVDEAGNAIDVPYSVTVRTTSPTIDITDNGTSIKDGALFNRAVTPVVSASPSDVTVTPNFPSGTAITAEGAHQLTATATDPVGHSASKSVTFTIDTTPPAIAISAPANNATLDTDAVTVTGTAGDAQTLTINGTSVLLGAGGSFTKTVALDFGENAIVVSGRDQAGNTGSAVLTITRSDAGTGILLTSPLDRTSTNRKTTVVTGRILTPANAQSLKVGPSTSLGMTVTWDPTGAFLIPDYALTEGSNTITATLTSKNGKTTTASVTITTDLTPPSLRILANDQVLNDEARFPATVILKADAEAGSTVELRVDGGVVASPATVVATGAHIAIATATDAAGNQTRVQRTFAIGAQAAGTCKPADFDPKDGSAVVANSLTISGSASGSVTINGIPAAFANGTFSGTAELSVEGANTVHIACVGGAEATLTIIRAFSAPSVTITSPDEMAVLGAAPITVTGTVGDGATEVTVNGVKATITGSTFSASPVTLNAGLNVLAARARNAAGRISIASRRVVSLQKTPALSIDFPFDNYTTGAGTIDVSGTWRDLDPTTITSTPAGTLETQRFSDTSGSFVLRGIPVSAIPQTITVSGRDPFGKPAEAKVLNVASVAGAPRITITSPAAEAFSASATVNVTGNVSAAQDSRVDVNGVVGTLSGTSFSGNATLAAGVVTPVIARVTQPNGDGAIATSMVTYLKGAPGVVKIFPEDGATAVDPAVIAIASFSAPMQEDGLVLLNRAGEQITGQRRLDRDVVSFAPATTLTPGERYTIVIRTTAKDLAGNPLASEVRSSFTIATTAPATAPQVDPIASPVCANQVTLKGTAPAAARIEITLGGIPQYTNADAGGHFSAQLSIAIASGYRVARVRVAGEDGSYSPETDVAFAVDCAGPVVTGATYDRSANVITVTYSKTPAITASDVALKLSDGTPVTFTMSTASNIVTITPGTPDPRALTLVLKIGAYTQTFGVNAAEGGPTNGSGYVSGEVLDATNGRPLSGVQVDLGGNSLISDTHGRYATGLAEGVYTIHASKSGYTEAWRQIVVPAGAGVVPIDIRLTALGNAGGDDAITRKATFSSVGQAPPPVLTAVGSQSLAGLLPLGWSPIASAEVRGNSAIGTLSFDLPNDGRSYTAVQYDPNRGEWRVVQAVVSHDVAITGAGAYALVYPDAGAPQAQTGGVLAGIADPCATQTCTFVKKEDLQFNPKVVSPNGRTVATLTLEAGALPSGTPVQAFINEQLTLTGGTVETTEPFSTDLILYRSLDGTTASATFHLAPSARAGAVSLSAGKDDILIFPYPGRLDRGTLVGPAGGPVPSDGLVQIDIPTGAAPSAVHATATSIKDLTTYSIAGFDVLAGFDFTLTGADALLKPANVTFSVNPAADKQLIVAEVAGPITRMVANANVTSGRVVTMPIDPSKLPLDGVVRQGRYLLLAAKQPIAFAFGYAKLGGYVGGATISASPLGVNDSSRATGLFVIPVVAKPATSFTLTPSYPTIGTGAAHTENAADQGAIIPIGDLALTSQPPVLQHVNVITTDGSTVKSTDLLGAIGTRNVVPTTTIQALFNQTITGSMTVIDAANTIVAGDTTTAGSALTWTPKTQLKPNSDYVVTIDSNTRGSYGAILGSSPSFVFTTVAVLTSQSVDASKIHITIPNDGQSTIYGDRGSLPSGWQAVALKRGEAFTTQWQATAGTDGDFTFVASPIALTDKIDLEVINTAGNVAAIIHLGPFGNDQSFVAPTDETVTYKTKDGVTVTVPAGSFDELTTITVSKLANGDAFANVPDFSKEVNFHAGVQIDLSCAPCTSRQRLEVTIPAPAGLDPNRPYELGWLGQSVRGPRVMLVDILRLAGSNFTSTADTGSALKAHVSSNASQRFGTSGVIVDQDAKRYMIGITRSGIYGAVSLQIQFYQGLVWAVADFAGVNLDIYLTQFSALYYAHEALVETKGRAIIPVYEDPANPKKGFEIVGVNSQTGLQAFSKVYDPLPAGPGAAFIVPGPKTDKTGPYPIYAIPSRVEIVDLQRAGVDLTSIVNFKIRLSGGLATIESSGFSTSLDLTVWNATSASQGKPIIAKGNTGSPIAVKASEGDRLVLIVEQRDIPPAAEFSVSFSRPIYAGETDDAESVNAFLHANGRIRLMKAAKPPSGAQPLFGDISNLARFELDSEGRRLYVRLPSELERGSFYRLDLDSSIAAADGDKPGLQLGQIQNKADEKPSDPLPSGVRLLFQVREVPPAITTFNATGSIRDLSLNGNVLLMAAGTAGILAYDVADPGSLTSDSKPIGYADGAGEMWAISSDEHGRIYAAGIDGIFGFIQSYRVEDFLGDGKTPKAVSSSRAGTIVSWVPGYSSGYDTVLSDRPEGFPRRLQLAEQNVSLSYKGSTALGAAVRLRGGTAGITDAGDLKKLALSMPIENGFPYRTQRITIENVTRDMRWSGDATAQTPAAINDVFGAENDEFRIVINERTYGVVTIFGYGLGVFDLNAMESNDLANPPSLLGERIRLTPEDKDKDCRAVTPDAIQDLALSPEVTITAGTTADQLKIYGADIHHGVLDANVPVSSGATVGSFPTCDDRAPYGFQLDAKNNPRIDKLESAFLARAGRKPFARFGGVQIYHWTLEARDNKAVAPAKSTSDTPRGQRDSLAGSRVERDYLLVPSYEYGLIIVDGTYPKGGWLDNLNLADIIWIPSGAVSVRVIPRSHYATVVDAQGRVLIVDLAHIDERWSPTGERILFDELFPSAAKALSSFGSYGVGASDPRILWASEPGLVSGSLAPVVDPDTGFLFAGQMQGVKTSVVPAIDPEIKINVDAGNGGLEEAGGVVPLGVDPPTPNARLNEKDPNASLAAFRLELKLPGAIVEKIAGSKLRLSVQSELVPGALVEQTQAPMPPAHLRTNQPDGTLDPRAVTSFYLDREIPVGMEQVLRHHSGFNKFVSPWIVAIADPRASRNYDWKGSDKTKAGCSHCDRPKRLQGLDESKGVYEIFSAGRSFIVRPEVCGAALNGCVGLQSIFEGTKYSYLNTADRLTKRIPTTAADTVRTPNVLVSGQAPPIAGGLLQERTYVHSGEIETSAVDLDAGGVNGWDVAAGRTYRSRTIGGTAFGMGWESNFFKRLRALPNGSVEYRDGAGEVWTFPLVRDVDYGSPPGLFLRLVRTDSGWLLFDQHSRYAYFDALGRLTAESDQFANPNAAAIGGAEGNATHYFYDSTGRLIQVVDALGRKTTIDYWKPAEATTKGAWSGLVKSITDWRNRLVLYEYTAPGVLTSVKMPEVQAASDTAQEAGVFSGRPESQYGYLLTAGNLNDLLELSANLTTIKDPASVVGKGPDRVTFTYDTSDNAFKRDWVTQQTWATGETATVSPIGASGGFATQSAVTDALGQRRSYDFTSDRKRLAIKKSTSERVPVLQFDPTLNVAPMSADAPPESLATEVLEFNGEDQVKKLKLPYGLTVNITPEEARGAAGLRPKNIVRSDDKQSITTVPHYDTNDGAANNLLEVGQGTGSDEKKVSEYRERPTPSRTNRENVTVNDTDLKFKRNFDTRGRLLKALQEGISDGVQSSVEVYTYYPDDAEALARGRIETVTRSVGDAKAVNMHYSYKALDQKGAVQETIEDRVRNTTTTVDFDSLGRPVHEKVVGYDGKALSDEAYGYDANGQLIFTRRAQKNLGPVITRTTYDPMLRQKDQSISNAAVDGGLQTLTTSITYDLKNLKITRTYPYVSNSSSVATEVTTLDTLGRATEVKTSDPANANQEESRIFRYDRQGLLSFESDRSRKAIVHVHDAFGREIATVDSLWQRHESQWDAWSQPVEETWLDLKASAQSTGSAVMVGHIKRAFTRNGKLRSVNDELIAGSQFRQTRFGWDGGDTESVRMGAASAIDTNIAGTARGITNQYDIAGRLVDQQSGEFDGISGLFTAGGVYSRSQSQPTEFSGMLPLAVHTSEPRAGTEQVTTTSLDGLGRPTLTTAPGGYEVHQNLDEAGNALTVKTSGHTLASTSSYDSRGLVTQTVLPDAKQSTLRYRYDALGNLTSYTDEMGKETVYTIDGLGRTVRTNYKDSTCEESVFEPGSGVLWAHRDRAGRWLLYNYEGYRLSNIAYGPVGKSDECTAPVTTVLPAQGALFMTYEYAEGNRLKRIATAEAAIVFDDYDFGGRPHTTRSIRYKDGSGMTTQQIADVHTQRHVWSVFDGERQRYRMPVPGMTVPENSVEAGWRSWIEESHDGAGNVTSMRSFLGEKDTKAPRSIADSVARGFGRLASRTRTLTPATSMVTNYGYAEKAPEKVPDPAPPGFSTTTAPAPYSGLLGRTEFLIGSDAVAGTVIRRDAARRISNIAPLATSTRESSFGYDERDRLQTSMLNAFKGDVPGKPEVDDSVDDADFRTTRSVMRLSSDEKTRIGSNWPSVALPSFVATPNDAHQIDTFNLDKLPPDLKSFVFAGGRRTSDGTWLADYDSLGRLVRLKRAQPSTTGPNRYEYEYDPMNRLVGRTVCMNVENPCQLDSQLRDGLPAETTFVWDPISDRLLSIFQAGRGSGASVGEYDGLLRQYVHGDQGYDDLIEVVASDSPGVTPKRYLPLFDEAGTGNLTAVLAADGTLIERVLYGDSYGASPRYLQGPVIEKVTHKVTKNSQGAITNVEIAATLSERVVADSLIAGTRLSVIKSDGSASKSSVQPALDANGQTIRWSLGAADWAAINTPDTKAVQVAINTSLRATGWGTTPVMKPAAWILALPGISSTAAEPVIVTEQTKTIEQSSDEESVFEVRDLYLVASDTSKTNLLTGFKGSPFIDPGSSYAFFRERWYSPNDGQFLTDDKAGYRDSSSLYAFCGSEPISCSDPVGMSGTEAVAAAKTAAWHTAVAYAGGGVLGFIKGIGGARAAGIAGIGAIAVFGVQATADRMNQLTDEGDYSTWHAIQFAAGDLIIPFNAIAERMTGLNLITGERLTEEEKGQRTGTVIGFGTGLFAGAKGFGQGESAALYLRENYQITFRPPMPVTIGGFDPGYLKISRRRLPGVAEEIESGNLRVITERSPLIREDVPHEHHVFLNHLDDYFNENYEEFDVQQYAVDIDRTLHELVHLGRGKNGFGFKAGWWEKLLFERIAVMEEAQGGRPLSHEQLEQVGRGLLRRFGVDDVEWHPYTKGRR